MKEKFEINKVYYLNDQSKLIYIKKIIKEKTLQHLKFYLQINWIISFATIKDLFNYLKDIFSNLL